MDFQEDFELIEKDTKQRQRIYRKGMRRGIAWTLVFMLVLSVATGVFLKKNGFVITSFKMDRKLASQILSEPVQKKTAEVLSALSAYYYDDIPTEKLPDGMYAGLVSSLGDKYTSYFSKEQYQEYLDGTNGTYYGIGAVLTQDKESLQITISKVYEGSPADKAGLKAGDVFVSADKTKAEGLELAKFVNYVRGEKGTKVKLVMLRDGKEKTFTVTRDEVEVPTIESRMLKNHTGYIAITEFDGVTADQFKKALKELKNNKMTSLIVDVRDNPGGMITAVTDILDELLPKGILVYTKDKAGKKTTYRSDRDELGLPLAVLVNENSASASEIFAGAVKDYKYGTLIGTKTFGKGIVQVLMPLSDGSAIKVTTAKYFTPKGHYIHEKGIEPDVKLEFQYQGDKTKDYDIYQDNQVLKAMEILKERR
ncbi:carboxyl-terminal processing protease [Lachnospiraceae bacterium XBB1006]|nr:carboxyl-terminal processing protease [Lachnospiraceae bacterium XBB1006]